jgi:hypothetical protein
VNKKDKDFIRCCFCGVKCDGKLIIRSNYFKLMSDKDIIVCKKCLNLYANEDYDELTKITNRKWDLVRKIYLCSCSMCFRKRSDFIEHLKDTKRWKSKHYAMDYNNLPSGFSVYEVKKNVRRNN